MCDIFLSCSGSRSLHIFLNKHFVTRCLSWNSSGSMLVTYSFQVPTLSSRILGGFLCLAQSVELIGSRSAGLVIIFLLTNALTALNLVRVFRHVFLGQPLLKTRRSAEVNWQMASPCSSRSSRGSIGSSRSSPACSRGGRKRRPPSPVGSCCQGCCCML